MMYIQQQYQSGSLAQQKSTIQKVLDENSQLVLLIVDLQSKGKQNECLEHQRTLHRNLTYLLQFDPSISPHAINLPPPDAFIPTQSTMINGQSDPIYRTQTNSPTPSNILNQIPPNTNQHSSSTSSNSVNKPTTPQQRPSYSQSYIPQQSYSIQQNGYGQYPMHHQQQNPSSHSNSSTNTQNLVSNQQNMYNNYNEQQQMYHPQQNYLMQQQWQNQSRMPMQQQQQQQYPSSYQQQ